jgi:hypothetical protein
MIIHVFLWAIPVNLLLVHVLGPFAFIFIAVQIAMVCAWLIRTPKQRG